MVARFRFLATAGIGSAQHHQLPLDTVFVEARAHREQYAGVRWSSRSDEQRALLRERLRSGEIGSEEYEALLDRLGIDHAAREDSKQDITPVTQLIGDAKRAVVLGEPGSGKTTLLRYLALRHAQTLLSGSRHVSQHLGLARIPLYIRAGDFARSQQRDAGFRAFIAPSFSPRSNARSDMNGSTR